MKRFRLTAILACLAVFQLSCSSGKPRPILISIKRNLSKDEVTRMAKERYIRIRVLDENGKVIGDGTAFVLSKDIALTTFHVLRPNMLTVEANDGQKYAPIMPYLPLDTLADLIAFRPNNPPDVQPLEIADEVELGGKLIDYSNAGAKNGVPGEYIVSEPRLDERRMLLVPESEGGESGSALLNKHGEVAGIVCGIGTMEFISALDGKSSAKEPITLAVSANAVSRFLSAVRAQNPNLK
jgi:hypothetical protein